MAITAKEAANEFFQLPKTIAASIGETPEFVGMWAARIGWMLGVPSTHILRAWEQDGAQGDGPMAEALRMIMDPAERDAIEVVFYKCAGIATAIDGLEDRLES